MMFYLFWVPIVIIFYSGYAYLSKQTNDYGGNWAIICYIYAAIGQWWVLVALFSKRLVFDAFLYDTLLLLSQYITFILLGATKGFTTWQWVGAALCLAGLTLMHVEA